MRSWNRLGRAEPVIVLRLRIVFARRAYTDAASITGPCTCRASVTNRARFIAARQRRMLTGRVVCGSDSRPERACLAERVGPHRTELD